MRIKGSVLFLSILAVASWTSCSFYDDEDATVIAYLKINDLLEEKLSKTAIEEIGRFLDDCEHMSWTISSDYDENAINTFYQKYYNESVNTYDEGALENDITAELWNYLIQTYSENIPAKAQNVQEGRYFTISELKEKYKDYKTVELDDFRPMELINIVMNEKLFDCTFISEGDVNLHTLYVFYLTCRLRENDGAASNKESAEATNVKASDIPYRQIIETHFTNGVPVELSIDEIISTFNKLSQGESPLYQNSRDGFEQFANDYFETDMFSGEEY